MFRSNFIFLVAVFVLFAGMVSAYSDLTGGWCGCTSCADCTAALNDNTICSKGVEADGGTYASVSTYCIDRPVNFSNGKIFDMNGSVFDGSGRSHGIWLWNNTNLTIANGTINDFANYGIILQNVTYADVHNVTINGTTGAGAGIALGVNLGSNAYDSHSIIYNCTIVDNHNANSAGLWISYADNNEVWDVVSSRNAHGIWVYGSQDNYIHDCVTDSSTGAIGSGVYCYSLVDRFAARNTFERINASSNPYAGIGLLDCKDSIVNHSRLISNNVGLILQRGAHLGPHNIEAHDNFVSGSTSYGIWVTDTPYTENSDSRFYNNTVQGSTLYGIYLNGTKNNTFMDNRVSTNFVGVLVENATNTSFEGDMVRVSTSAGLWFMGSDDSSAENVHLFLNGADFVADANGVSQDIALTNVIFDGTAGSYLDFTNLSLTDSMSGTQMYSIDWSSNSTALPADLLSFEDKWVNITNQTAAAVSIDQLVWSWTDSELPGYIESTFELWEDSAGTWSNTGAVLDTGANTLTLSNWDPSSDYGILQNLSKCPVITSPAAYQLQADLTGAPNAASGPLLLDAACIIIESDDVYIDCNGHTITNDGTANATALLVNGSASGTYENITIENCPSMQDYRYGAYLYHMDDSLVQNSSFYNNTDRGLYLHFVDGSIVHNSSFRNNDYGLNVRSSNGNNFTDLQSFDNGWHGIFFYASSGNLLNNSASYNNTGSGVAGYRGGNNEISFTESYENDDYGVWFYTDSDDNTISNCPIHDNGMDGVFVESGCDNAVVEHSTLANNTAYGMYAYGCNNLSMENIHIYNNTAGGLRARAVAFTWAGDSLLFDNPLGNMQNYTNLSISDSLAGGEEYEVSWTSNSTALPGQAISFENKWVDISTLVGAPSIDEIIWHWTAAEEALSPDYVPAQFKLLEYDGADWNLMNGTPDTGARTLSAYSLNPASDYGILQYVANVSVLKMDQTAFQASPGGIVEFNITINNTGNITLDTVQVIDELPAGLQWAGESPSPDSCTNGECTWNNVGPLAPGAATTILVNASVDAGVVGPGNEVVNLTNYANATGTSSLGEILFGESEANATVYYANVSAVKTDITAVPPSPGGMVEYQIAITNTGNVTLDPVSVVDTLPAEFTYNATDTVPVTVTGTTVVNWTIGPIAPGATVTILMNATVNSGTANGTYTNTVDVEAQPPNGDNVTSTDTVDVGVYAPAVSVVKTASAYTATVGTKLTFNLTITNTGESNLTVWANDTLPAQLGYVAGEADPLPTAVVGQSLYWDAIVADLTPGSTYNITYNVTVLSAGSGITNDVIVTGVPPSGDNVTDNASVTLTGYKPPSGGGGDWKDLEIEVDDPVCVGEETVITVKVGSSEFENAEIHIKTLAPGYTYWYTGLGATDSEGELTFTPEFVGEHTIYADTDEHGYNDAQESFDVVECEPQEAECMENEDCPECYDCEQHRDPAYNQCVLAEGANCGIYDPCPPATECQETEENPCPDPDSIPICIDCVCDWVECITDDDCPSGEECIDYECTDEETPPEEGCTTNETCEYDEYCDIETGECVDLECICGYPANHACIYYECCDDETCEDLYGDSFYCNLDIHECEEIPGEGDEPGLDVDTPGEGSVGDPVVVTVTSEDGPVPGAEVTIVIDGTPYGMGQTDGDGQLEFTPDQPGDYRIQVSKEGFASGEDEFVATPGETIWDVIIRGVWILLFILILVAILYVLATRKKKRRPKDQEE